MKTPFSDATKIDAAGLLKILLAYSPNGTLSGKVAVLHRTVFRLTRAHPELDIMFDTNGQSPYSEDIDNAVRNLLLSGIIYCRDMVSAGAPYLLGCEQESLRQDMLKKHGQGKDKVFRMLAGEFYAEVNR